MERFIRDDRTGLDYELVGDCYLIAGEDESASSPPRPVGPTAGGLPETAPPHPLLHPALQQQAQHSSLPNRPAGPADGKPADRPARPHRGRHRVPQGRRSPRLGPAHELYPQSDPRDRHQGADLQLNEQGPLQTQRPLSVIMVLGKTRNTSLFSSVFSASLVTRCNSLVTEILAYGSYHYGIFACIN